MAQVEDGVQVSEQCGEERGIRHREMVACTGGYRELWAHVGIES